MWHEDRKSYKMLKSEHRFSDVIHIISLALLFKVQVKGEVLFLRNKGLHTYGLHCLSSEALLGSDRFSNLHKNEEQRYCTRN